MTDEQQIHEQKLLNNLANQLSLSRIKTEGLHFDRDYKRDPKTNELALVTEKAVIRTHGKTSKILIGEHYKYKTWDEAQEHAVKHWAEYFKARRQLERSATMIAGDKRRQKRYYNNKRAQSEGIERNQ